MKKTILILSMITLILAGCKKFDEIEASKVEIMEEKIEKGWDYIKINVEYDYPVALEAVSLYLSEKEDMGGAEVYECSLEGNKFSVEVEGLKEGTACYYCYEYDNGYEKTKGEKGNIKTISKPIVVTKNVSDVTIKSAILNGSLTNNDASNQITEIGFCWDTKQEPSIEGSHYNNGSMNGTGTFEFSYNLTSLQDNVTYYVRAYANTSYGIIYGEEVSFTTLELLLPEVTTNNVTNITTKSAVCGGNVTLDGNGTVTSRGVCWSTSQNPTINDNKTADGSGTGSYTSNLSNLAFQTTYYVRAYVTNEKGTSYGEEKSFTTESLIDGHDWIDLGLPSGLKWATYNVGATSPEEYGDYFAWGETTTKETYTEDNCTTYKVSRNYILGDERYDAARANWGGTWRLPREEDQKELVNNCTWIWTQVNGVNGVKVTGPNGNNIFFPAAGYRDGRTLCYDCYRGCYWNSMSYDAAIPTFASNLCFDDNKMNVGFISSDRGYRYFGYTIRPVTFSK